MIMHSAKRIFCIIPAYNEAETITKVINDVRPYVSEIVVVDDGSGPITIDNVERNVTIEDAGSGGLTITNVKGHVENKDK